MFVGELVTSQQKVAVALLSPKSAFRLRLGLGLGLVRGDGEAHGDDESDDGELHVVVDGTCVEK